MFTSIIIYIIKVILLLFVDQFYIIQYIVIIFVILYLSHCAYICYLYIGLYTAKEITWIDLVLLSGTGKLGPLLKKTRTTFIL